IRFGAKPVPNQNPSSCDKAGRRTFGSGPPPTPRLPAAGTGEGLVSAMPHATSPAVLSAAISPSPFRALLFVTRSLTAPKELHHDRLRSRRRFLRNAGAWPRLGASGR